MRRTTGSTRPCVGDVDGDGANEIVIGLGPFPQSGGWMQVRSNAAGGYASRGWGRLDAPAYSAAVGGTRPTLRNLDADAAAEMVVGIDPYRDGGHVFVLDDDATALRLLVTIRVGDAAYRIRGGESWPVR